MKLLVDVGNTRIKWAQARKRVLAKPRAATHAGNALRTVLQTEWSALPRPEQVLIANVAGAEAAAVLQQYCETHFGITPGFVVSRAADAGVVNGYRDPRQLGVDRWAGVIGAYVSYGGPVCVVACGTAITIDTVTGDGQHLGGLIAPGLVVMQRALAAAAPALPAEAGAAVALYARDTLTAVTSGVLYAAAGCVERALGEIRADQGVSLKVLLTGGDAELLRPHLSARITLAPHLVLEGLAVLAELQA
ncbi:MAG: type III pantothenate kinase [Gammaproteobacteria bacterium]